MSVQFHRLAAVVCAAMWFLLGMHAPLVHTVMHHGRTPGWSVLAMVALVGVVAVAALVVLLGDRGAGTAR